MSSKQQNDEKQKCLWYDVQNDKYYLIDNITGETHRVNKNSSFVKEFDKNLTGQVTYHERIEYSQRMGKPGFMPNQPSSINPNKKSMFYTPQCDKFESYAQFPQPRTEPYFNQKQQYYIQILNQEYDDVIQNFDKYQLNSQKIFYEGSDNHSLFKFNGIRKSNHGISFLSNTIKDENQMLNEKQIKILQERSQTHFKSAQELPQLNATKIINGRPIYPPNQLKRFQQNHQKQNKNDYDEQLQKLTTSNNTQTKSTLNDLNKSTYIQPLEQSELKMIEKFVKDRDQEISNFIRFKQASSLFQTTTFDGQSFNRPQRIEQMKLKNETNFNQTLSLQKQELDQFSIPIEIHKKTLKTKGRFNISPRNTKQLYEQDRQIMMKLYPELYLEKVDEQKLKQDNLRQKINKMKEQEMLERNLRNKA